MVIEDNVMRGQSLMIKPGESLSLVPLSHKHLLKPDIVDFFENAPVRFQEIANRAPVPSMKKWLEQLIGENQYQLQLHTSDDDPKSGQAGIEWKSDFVRGAEIGSPQAFNRNIGPEIINELFELIGYLDWMGYGYPGYLAPPCMLADQCATWIDEKGPQWDMECTVIWGGFNGDLLIASPPNHGGWRMSEGGTIKSIGTIEETMEWYFDRLNRDLAPNADDL